MCAGRWRRCRPASASSGHIRAPARPGPRRAAGGRARGAPPGEGSGGEGGGGGGRGGGGGGGGGAGWAGGRARAEGGGGGPERERGRGRGREPAAPQRVRGGDPPLRTRGPAD